MLGGAGGIDDEPATGPHDSAGAEGSTMQVYRALRAAILDGVLSPGESVSQVKLASAFGLSRSPLREALRLLQHEGLVVGAHNRRMRIAPLTVRDLEQLYAMRVLAEPLAVRVTVPQLDERALGEIVTANQACRRALESSHPAAVQEPHRRLHMGMCVGAGVRLRRHVADLWDFAERYRQLTLTIVDRQSAASASRVAIVEHDAIVEAVLAGDATTAASLLSQHLVRVGIAILLLLDSAHDPLTLRMALSRALET